MQNRARTEPQPAGARALGPAPLRILLLAPHPFFEHRGSPIAVRLLAAVLAERGYRIDLVTYEQGEPVEIPNCTIHRIRAPFGVAGIRPGFSLKKLLCDAAMLRLSLQLVRRHRYDVVHAVEEGAFMAIAAKRATGTPFIYDMDSSLAQQMIETFPMLRAVRPLLTAAERWAVRESMAVLAVCRSIEETARTHAPSKLVSRIEDISLLAPKSLAAESLRQEIGRDGPIVLYVGNLAPYQGIDLLLASFAKTRQASPHAELVVIGGADDDIRHYRQRAKQLGIAASAHFLGRRPVGMLGSYLRQADVLVSPRTRGHNTPMKIYSYLDSGTPIVATRLLTHTQVLDDGIALLADPDPAAFGSALARLLEDRELGARLADRARGRLLEEYSREAFTRKVHRFYDAIERSLHEQYALAS